jgi:tetratricopeptide (TPR) repeat protein
MTCDRNAYNQDAVLPKLRSQVVLVSRAVALLIFALAAAVSLEAQTAAMSDLSGLGGQDKILLVLPFDNATEAQPAPAAAANPVSSPAVAESTNLEWIRDAVPEILNSRFSSAGFFPLTRGDRLYALDHLGLPETFQPSRATALRIAETLDANYILFGSYRVNGSMLSVEARVVDVAKLRLSAPITESGQISTMIPLLNLLAWRITKQLDPSFNVAQETFRVAGAGLRLDAFEQYVRGISERDVPERLRHLKKATELSPDFTAAWLATGELQFANQQYEEAAVSFGKAARANSGSDPAQLEAGFERGLSLIFSGNYAHAEEAFAAVARVLPLPEVVNNQAVAMSRLGQDGTALYRQAEAGDPTDADYHFNLAVSLQRHGEKNEAAAEISKYLTLRPNDSEAIAARDAWTAGKTAKAGAEPLERIKRTYDGAAFRQAALMLDEVESARMAALPGPERARKLCKSAREKLDRGLLLEAERGYQAAISADGHSAEAHAGLAQVRERAGDPDSARKEAEAALDRQPNFDAYMVLSRLDLGANKLIDARREASQAEALDSTSRAAKELGKAIDSRIEARSASDAAAPTAKP